MSTPTAGSASAGVDQDTAMSDAQPASAADTPTVKKRKRIDDTHEDNSAPEPVASASSSAPVPLLGQLGTDAIKSGLMRTTDPAAFIADFQRQHGIRGDRSLEAGLEFLDLFTPRPPPPTPQSQQQPTASHQQAQGKRGAVYAQMIHDMVASLTKQIEGGTLSQERQLALLEASFPYIRTDELTPIPMALLLALTRARALPVRFLKALCASSSTFLDTLPLELRRALMELDPEAQFWKAPQMEGFVRAYLEDRGRIQAYMQLTPIDEVTKALKATRAPIQPTSVYASSASAAAPVSPSARALQSILDWIGPQVRLYRFFCNHARDHATMLEQTNGEGDSGWRCLRVDLLMRLHELESAPASLAGEATPAGQVEAALSAAAVDPLHTWAWCLDAIAKKEELDPKLLDRLLGPPEGELAEEGTASDQSFLRTLVVKKDTLHDLGLLTGHVLTLGALCRATLAALGQVVETEGATPRAHPNLPRLVKMLHLGLMTSGELAKASLSAAGASKHVHGLHLPSPVDFDGLLDDFFPALGEMMLLAQLGESEEVGEKVKSAAATSTIARAMVLQYVCSRIQAKDVAQVTAFLTVLPDLADDHGHNVWQAADHAGEQQLLHSLLHTLVTLLHTHLLSVVASDPLFRSTVFPRCLIPLARHSTVAHAEALRLVIQCEQALATEEVRAYVRQLTQDGKRSARGEQKETDAGAPAMVDSAAAPSSSSSALTAQIDALYEQLKTLRPQAFD